MIVTVGLAASSAATAKPAAAPQLAVAPQYDTTHIYVAPEDFDEFRTASSRHSAVTSLKRASFR
jgi:hypothetical protein